ncbi:hypothetical protein Goarm_023033, partial [Gossypium armourianum]|nr:hypothetical protein [Gossypium armourianum]
MGRDKITLLEEEFVQLSMTSSLVVPSDNPLLICFVWTWKSYNLDSFRAQLKSIWKTRKKFEIQVTGQSIGPCPSECNKKDLTHAVGSTFGGVIKSKVKGEFCRLRVQLDAQRPLRRGIFISTGHGVKECTEISVDDREKVEDEHPCDDEVDRSSGSSKKVPETHQQTNEEVGSKMTFEFLGTNALKHNFGNSEACRPGAMKMLNWNVRRLGSMWAIRRLRHMLKINKPQIIFLMETKLTGNQMENVRRKCNFNNGIDVDTDGTRGSLSLVWNGNDLVQLRSFSKNHIDVEIMMDD